jgi:hypothetical protein
MLYFGHKITEFNFSSLKLVILEGVIAGKARDGNLSFTSNYHEARYSKQFPASQC